MPPFLPLSDYLQIVVALLIMVDPLGASPIFISLTAAESAGQRARIVRRAAVVAALVLLLSALFGRAVLAFFGIGIPAFQIGGGILFMILALDMLKLGAMTGKQTREEARETVQRSEHHEDISVVPLGVPLLAGPGAISAIISYSHRASGPWHYAAMCVIPVAVAAIAWAVLRIAMKLGHAMGRTGLAIVTRLMGLILLAISIEFIQRGLVQMFPALAGK